MRVLGGAVNQTRWQQARENTGEELVVESIRQHLQLVLWKKGAKKWEDW